MALKQHKYLLDESEMPTSWYNIIPDLPAPPPPPLHPATHEPVGPDDLAPLFPMDLIRQEVSTEMTFGQSVTDACMGWEMTLPTLRELAAAMAARRSS